MIKLSSNLKIYVSRIQDIHTVFYLNLYSYSYIQLFLYMFLLYIFYGNLILIFNILKKSIKNKKI